MTLLQVLISLLPAIIKLPTRLLWLLVFIAGMVSIQAGTYQSWGLYHYHTGSKYFREVGYFDLYECSALARGIHYVPRRNLHTYQFHWITPECDNFSPERWEEFSYDLGRGDEFYHYHMMVDKGLNATPTWIAIGEKLAGLPEQLLIWLDPLLLGAAIIAAGILLDWRKAAYVALFIVVFYGTYGRLWGHFLQWGWLALVIVGIALIHRKRDAGGLLVGFSAALAIFPIFLLVGRSKRILAWSAVGLAGGLLLGLTTSRGWDAYPEFIQNMILHSSHIRYEPLNVGLFNTLSMALSSPDQLNGWRACFQGGYCEESYSFASPWLLWLALLPLVIWSRWGLMFGLITLSRYYYLIMAILPLEDENQARWLLGLNAVIMLWMGIHRETGHQFAHLLWIPFLVGLGWPIWRRILRVIRHQAAIKNPSDLAESNTAV